MTDATSSCGCPEYRSVSRRSLFGGAALVGGAALAGGPAMRAYGVSTGDPVASTAAPVLVVLSLRGAADGLSLVVPHGDPVYHRARPRLAIPRNALVAADAMFGLHPALAPLLPLWNSGRLAAVHATGMATPNRSHFAAMEAIEDAAPGSTERIGWLNRLLGEIPGTSPLQGTALGSSLPTSLFGPQPAFAVSDVGDGRIAGADQAGLRRSSLEHAWSGSSRMARAVQNAMTGVDGFAPVIATPAQQPTGTPYPDTVLGRTLRDVSRVVRSGVAAQVITVDQGDWDTHTDQGTTEWGTITRNASELARSIAAFFEDLGTEADRVTLVTLSEFGRRVRENADWGTDHGFGNVMLVAGAGLRGARYLGRWPGLSDTLDADVLVTTDYRSVLSEVVTRRFGVSTAQVFPQFTPESVGLMA